MQNDVTPDSTSNRFAYLLTKMSMSFDRIDRIDRIDRRPLKQLARDRYVFCGLAYSSRQSY